MVPSFNNRTKELLGAGQTAIGTFFMTSEPAFVEMMGYAGFDYVIIDTEHGPNDPGNAQELVRAAEISGLTPIVRVTTNDPGKILRALDIGARGVLVPQVNTAAEAQAAVRAAKYAPEGERGLAGVVRAARYGFLPMPEYLAAANRETLVIVQVEHVDAVNHLDEILAVEGVDGIFIGPTDLSQSMGITGQFYDPAFRKVIEQIFERVSRAGKWIGMFCLDAADAKYWRDRGARFLALGTDSMLFAAALRPIVKELK